VSDDLLGDDCPSLVAGRVGLAIPIAPVHCTGVIHLEAVPGTINGFDLLTILEVVGAVVGKGFCIDVAHTVVIPPVLFLGGTLYLIDFLVFRYTGTLW